MGAQRGQSVLEYVIITSLIGMATVVMFRDFGSGLNTRIKHMKEYVNQEIGPRLPRPR